MIAVLYYVLAALCFIGTLYFGNKGWEATQSQVRPTKPAGGRVAHESHSSQMASVMKIQGDFVAGNKVSYGGGATPKVAPSVQLDEGAENQYGVVEIQTIGSPGIGAGQFQFGGGSDTNAGIFVDENYLYVTDWSNRRLQRLKVREGLWAYYDSLESEQNFHSPVQVDSSGNIYLPGNGEIHIFNRDKKLIQKLNVNISNFRRFALDPTRNIFIQSDNNNAVNKYNSKGELLVSFGGFGDVDGKFNNSGYTADIVSDSVGHIYILDAGGKRVQKFDNAGNFLKKWPVNVAGYCYMTIDEHDMVYVLEDDSRSLKKYNSEGVFQATYSIPDGVQGNGYIFVRKNTLFVSNRYEHNIRAFSLVSADERTS